MILRPASAADNRTPVSALLPVSSFSVGRRFILSSSLTFVATLLLSTFTTLEVAAQQPLKLNTKPQIVTFLGSKGDGGSPCQGIGMCRGAMLRNDERISK